MTSPSTLVRKALAAKSPRAAARFRAMAAKLRREIRQGKVKPRKKRKAKKLPEWPDAVKFAEAMTELKAAQGEYASGGMAIGAAPAAPAPLIDGEEIERLRKLAAKRHRSDKQEPDAFAIGLRTIMVDSKNRGRGEALIEVDVADKRSIDALKAQREAHAISMVSGFIAIVKHAEKYLGSGLPPTMTFTGHTIAKVYDALRDAGYTEDGKDAGFRPRR